MAQFDQQKLTSLLEAGDQEAIKGYLTELLSQLPSAEERGALYTQFMDVYVSAQNSFDTAYVEQLTEYIQQLQELDKAEQELNDLEQMMHARSVIKGPQ